MANNEAVGDVKRARLTDRRYQTRQARQATRMQRLAGRLQELTAPPDENGCHLWLGPVNKKTGYGTLCSWLVHRFCWTHVYGPIPRGQLVRHRCHVRRCVNPDHLLLGDAMDNMEDRRERERVEDLKRLTVTLPGVLYRRLEAQAKKNDRSLAAEVRRALEQHLDHSV